MDPRAALKRWRNALREFDYEEARETAEDLRSWARMGGFIPADAGLTPLERDLLGLTRKRKRVSTRFRANAAAPKKIAKKRKTRNPENPRAHFPKTKRGRPPVNRGWSIQLFAAGEKHLQTKRLKVGKEEAVKLARGMVGKRVKGARVAKVILDGPK